MELEGSCDARCFPTETTARVSEVSVRYIVTDLDAAVAFYTGHLDFAVEMRPAPTFAMLGDLIRGIGGNQVLLEDPSGNPVELFEPARRP